MNYYIKRITIEEDGVHILYLNSQQKDANLQCRDICSPSLTETYNAGSRIALDRYIIDKMSSSQYFLIGKHPSLSRYQKLKETDDYNKLFDIRNKAAAKHEEADATLVSELLDKLSSICSKGYRS